MPAVRLKATGCVTGISDGFGWKGFEKSGTGRAAMKVVDADSDAAEIVESEQSKPDVSGRPRFVNFGDWATVKGASHFFGWKGFEKIFLFNGFATNDWTA